MKWRNIQAKRDPMLLKILPRKRARLPKQTISLFQEKQLLPFSAVWELLSPIRENKAKTNMNYRILNMTLLNSIITGILDVKD